jgi:hypothetical protein
MHLAVGVVLGIFGVLFWRCRLALFVMNKSSIAP